MQSVRGKDTIRRSVIKRKILRSTLTQKYKKRERKRKKIIYQSELRVYKVSVSKENE